MHDGIQVKDNVFRSDAGFTAEDLIEILKEAQEEQAVHLDGEDIEVRLKWPKATNQTGYATVRIEQVEIVENGIVYLKFYPY